MRWRNTFTSLAVTALSLVFVAVVEAQQKSFAVVFENSNLADVLAQGFTALAVKGCEQAAAENPGYVCKYIFKPASATTADALTTHINNEITKDTTIVHTIFMGFALVTISKRIAELQPSLTVSIMDASIDGSLKNYQGILFPEDEPGFLAGVIAGSVTTSNVVGVIGGNPVPPVQRLVYGFLNGVKYVNPNAIVYGTFAYDPTWMGSFIGPFTAQGFMARGADVIFGAGGGIGSNGIYRAAQNRKWVIGVDIDESISTFNNRTDPGAPYVLTSALKNVDTAAYTVFTEKVNGKFFAGNKRMDVTNGGVGLSRCSSVLSCNAYRNEYIFAEADINNPTCSSVSKTSVGDLMSSVLSKLGVGSIGTGVNQGILQGVGKTANRTWSKIEGFGPTPNGLSGHTQTDVGNNTYLFFGGQNVTGALNNNLYYYALDSVNWTSIAPTGTWPAGIQNHGAAFRRSTQELIIIGGTKAGGIFNSDIWKYSLISGTWSFAPISSRGPSARTRHAVALIGDRYLYLYGGQDEGASVKNDLWRLDLNNDEWTNIPGSSAGGGVPGASFSSTLLPVNGTNLILFGGNNGANDLSSLWRFSTQSETWRLESPDGVTPPGLSAAAGVVLDARRLMFFGGSSSKVPQTTAYIYNAATNEWSIEGSLVLPFALQGMTASSFNQSAVATACRYADTGFSLCTPVNRTMVLLYGGAQPSKGISGSMMAAYIPDEIPPRFPQYIAESLLSVGYAVGAIGIVLCLVVLAATLYFQKLPAFKSASPIFLCLYSLGAMSAFLGVVFYNFPLSLWSCNVALWLFSEGCMLLFSAMVVKNWRIYYIFTHGTKAKGHMTKDFVLLSMVLAMLLVNTGVLIAFSIVAKYQISNVIIDGDAWPVCASPASGTWIWILIAPISATLLFGLFISFFTRNVTSKFNESGQINMSIYIVTLSLIVLVPLSLTIKLPPTLHVINSLLVCLSLYTVIGANFFSKIYGSVVKPTEVMGLSGGGTGASSITSTGDSMLCCRTCNQPLTGAKKAVNSALMSANKTPA